MNSNKTGSISQNNSTLSIVLLAVVFVAAFSVAVLAASEIKRLERDGITIDYPAELDAVANKLGQWLSTRLSEVEGSESVDLSQLQKKQSEILAFVSKQLAMEEAGEHMRKVLTQMSGSAASFTSGLPDPQHLRLWKRNELERYIEGGGEIPPGYEYDHETGEVSFSSSLRPGQRASPRGLTLILLSEESNDELFDEAKGKVNKLLDGLSKVVPGFVGMALHETAEVGIVYDLGVTFAQRRWFTEGVANYLVWVTLKEYFPEAVAQEFLKAYDPEPYADVRNRANLSSWLAKELAPKSKSAWDQRLELARYAFATHEIIDLVSRHGPDVIPAIFKEIAKYEVRDKRAILDAIKKVTKEDFEAILKKYGTMAADDFEGLAIKHFVVGICEKDDKGKWHMTKETTTIPLITDGKHGICLHFHYATPNPPIALKAEFVGPPKPDGSRDVMTQTGQLTKKSDVVNVRWWATDEDDKLGECHIRTYFDNKLYRDIELRVVKG